MTRALQRETRGKDTLAPPRLFYGLGPASVPARVYGVHMAAGAGDPLRGTCMWTCVLHRLIRLSRSCLVRALHTAHDTPHTRARVELSLSSVVPTNDLDLYHALARLGGLALEDTVGLFARVHGAAIGARGDLPLEGVRFLPRGEGWLQGGHGG